MKIAEIISCLDKQGEWVDVYKRQILLSSLVPLLNTGKSSAVNYNEFVSILDKQKVTEMTVMPGIYVTSVEGKYTKNEKGKDVTYAFKTNVPQTDEELNSLMQLLEDKGIKVSVLDAKSENMLMDTILGLLPVSYTHLF